ncbi:ABC transporter substrate-binding protein [Nocardioides piscis]|uniref:ABC transporter substrate-binding protein n=1 Tax=Nocardioides piscis TaxID=2714938 RepID=A0A6G7YEI7_9ACTN|nr:ABC transporter substrate-binding protein [Nocardioides piscis]QIK75314.1 ABC transporter substrate-binding protein [Nocardioides piscis]
MTAGVVGLVLALAACGSQLQPEDLATAGAGTAQGGEVIDPALGADPGTGTTGGSAGSTGSGTTGGSTGTGATGATGATGSGSTSGSGGSGSAAAPADGGGGAKGTGENSATGATAAGACDGFANQTGITDDKIVVGNASDISGPVPGIFESAQLGTRAYAAYFNSTGDICGRKLEVLNLDSRADAGADQQAYAQICEQAFAGVGSMSAFDQGGAATAQGCGLPDIRSTAITSERTGCSTCFGAQSASNTMLPSATPKFLISKFGGAAQKIAMIYIDVAAAAQATAAIKKSYEANGAKVVYYKGMDVSEFNYAPYVQEMKSAGVEMVYYTGPYQNTIKLQQAMKQQGFDPIVYQDATVYDAGYVAEAGSLAEGTVAFLFNDLFTNSGNKEMQLYASWLQQVKPGAQPSVYGLFAWSAARLFVERSIALGGKLSRESLVAEFAKTTDWTANGLHAPQAVKDKTTASCVKFVQYTGGKWVQISPGDYTCGPLTKVG